MRSARWLVGAVVVAILQGGCTNEVSGTGGGAGCDETNPNKSYFRDADTDGFGDPATELARCSPPAGFVANDLDCDDADERVHPETAWHPDVDGDGFGDAATSVTQCVAPTAHILDGSDCNDTDDAIGPLTAWYADTDGDGFGDPAAEVKQCTPPAGHVRNAEDCDDGSSAVNPGTVWHQDADGDGFGVAVPTITQCAQPPGHALVSGDCDDANALVNPDTVWHQDVDKDGFGSSAADQVSCAQPMGYVLDGGDCSDADNLNFPGRGNCAFDVGGKSCKEVLDAGDSRGDGAYLLDMDGAAGNPPVVAWCDMTSDGGGWTALINPSDKSMPTPTLPSLSYGGSVLSGSDTCPNSATLIQAYGWNALTFNRCGDTTIRTTLSWPNGIGAADLMYAATLSGQTIATVTADGIDLVEDAVTQDAGGGRCEFHNAAGASVVTPIATCPYTLIDAAPTVRKNAFAGALNLELTSGAACQPTCQYSVGQTIHRLFVR